MKYKAKIGENTQSVTVEPLDENQATAITLGQDPLPLKVGVISPNHLHLNLNGRTANVFVARSPEGTWVWSGGRARLVEDADKTASRSTRRRGPGDTPGEVTPPTPATVVRVLVEAGDEVDKGRPLIVVSAMKMETTLAAPYSGRVKSINAEAGAKVNPGEILIDIEGGEDGREEEED